MSGIIRKIINAVSITQSNEQKCHNNDMNCKRKRRHADKKRRQFLQKDLQKELDELPEN